MFALAATGIYLLQECIYAYQERNDMGKLSRVMFLLLCHITSIVKQAVFHVDADSIDALVASLDDAALQGGSSAANELLSRRTSTARRLQRAYSGMAVLTCILWLVLTAARYARTRTVDFPFWLPAAADEPHQFALVLVYSYYVTTLVGIANTTMDAFIGTLLDQYTAQLEILRLDVQALSLRAADTDEAILLELFYECLDHYNKICTVPLAYSSSPDHGESLGTYSSALLPLADCEAIFGDGSSTWGSGDSGDSDNGSDEDSGVRDDSGEDGGGGGGGAFFKPNGILVNLNIPKGVINAVLSWSSFLIGICQYPAFRSNADINGVGFASWSKSSILGIGYVSGSWMKVHVNWARFSTMPAFFINPIPSRVRLSGDSGSTMKLFWKVRPPKVTAASNEGFNGVHAFLTVVRGIARGEGVAALAPNCRQKTVELVFAEIHLLSSLLCGRLQLVRSPSSRPRYKILRFYVALVGRQIVALASGGGMKEVSVCRGAQLVAHVFGDATFVQFAIGGWILCMAAYKVVSISVLSVEFASMLLFIMCILTELFLYCYFGNQLTEESARVQQALFACGWERWPRGARRARRALLLARERAQRPLRAVAAGVVPLSLDTFLKILKSSYTFYAVLRQTK
ncbi:uncharacterized protein LOC113228730 [Hyposmocoma kahamanoa]|uniref:uncharacterized protein LOC113228730 n=1 Tax=Hyposmocoma kahamanoa TaxID=1477025 RepID=UPI000E6D5DEB|nr:uncharacterized protein LOC113228730 [Hyposmocoma kahamanoa]